MNFFSKFIQLQDLMFAHNAGLTASHPYASSPSSWPFAKKGISFWTLNDGHKQIYLVGNLVGWWTTAGAVILIFGIFPATIFAERRNIPVLSECESLRSQDLLRGAHLRTQPLPIVCGTRAVSSSSYGSPTTSPSSSLVGSSSYTITFPRILLLH